MKAAVKYLLFLLVPLVYLGCKKENDDKQNNEVFLLEKDTYQPMELASIKVEGITMYDSIYDGSFNNNISFKLKQVDSFLVFLVPGNLTVGTHNLSVEISGKSYSESFQLTAAPVIAQPDVYVGDFMTAADSALTELQQNISTFPQSVQADILANLQATDAWKAQWVQAYQDLDATERMNAALFLQSNNAAINELISAINEFNASARQLRINGVEDYENGVKFTIWNMLRANYKMKKEVTRFLLLTGTGGLVFGPIGALVGAGIGIVRIVVVGNEVVAANQLVLDQAIQPDMLYDVRDKNTLTFYKGRYQNLEITNRYRTVYNADARGGTQMIGDLTKALSYFKESIEQIRSFIPDWLGGGTTDIGTIPTYTTSDIQVHSKYITIDNISISTITHEIDRTDGFFKVRFNIDGTDDHNFSFRVVYSDPYFGTTSKLVIAELKSDEVVITEVKVVNNAVLPAETGENVHSNIIPLQVKFLGVAPTEIAITTYPGVLPGPGDWKSVTPVNDSVVNYTYNAQYTDMFNKGQWNLQIYLKSNDSVSAVFSKFVYYTTIQSFTPYPENAPGGNTNGTIMTAGPVEITGGVTFRTHLFYEPTNGGIVCGANASFSELKLTDETDYSFSAMYNAGYRAVNYYDASGTLVCTLQTESFVFYTRACGNLNQPSPFLDIAFAELVYYMQ